MMTTTTTSQPLAMLVTSQRSSSHHQSLQQALGSPCYGVPHALRGLDHFQCSYPAAGMEGAFQQQQGQGQGQGQEQGNSLTRMIFGLDKATGFVDFPLYNCQSSSDCDDAAAAADDDDDDDDDESWENFLEPDPIAEHVLAKMGVAQGQTQQPEDSAFDIFDIVSVADMKAAFSV
jgi:hypothetical protein